MKISNNKVLVITRGNNRYLDEMREYGLDPVKCPIDHTSLFANKDVSEALVVILTDETPEEVKKLAGGLQILCIDEEKSLFLYGKKDQVEQVSSMIPSLFIISEGFLFKDLFKDTVLSVMEFIKQREASKLPILLYVDDSDVYINKLKPYLEDKFIIYTCRDSTPAEIVQRLKMADLAVFSTELTYPLISFTDIFMAITRKKSANPDFSIYYITGNDVDQKRMNVFHERLFIALSKQMDVKKTADFFIKRYAR